MTGSGSNYTRAASRGQETDEDISAAEVLLMFSMKPVDFSAGHGRDNISMTSEESTLIEKDSVMGASEGSASMELDSVLGGSEESTLMEEDSIMGGTETRIGVGLSIQRNVDQLCWSDILNLLKELLRQFQQDDPVERSGAAYMYVVESWKGSVFMIERAKGPNAVGVARKHFNHAQQAMDKYYAELYLPAPPPQRYVRRNEKAEKEVTRMAKFIEAHPEKIDQREFWQDNVHYSERRSVGNELFGPPPNIARAHESILTRHLPLQDEEETEVESESEMEEDSD